VPSITIAALVTVLLKRREVAGGEEVFADGVVELLQGVEVLLLPARQVPVEILDLLLFRVGGGGREV
jgi:hypothetical protein